MLTAWEDSPVVLSRAEVNIIHLLLIRLYVYTFTPHINLSVYGRFWIVELSVSYSMVCRKCSQKLLKTTLEKQRRLFSSLLRQIHHFITSTLQGNTAHGVLYLHLDHYTSAQKSFTTSKWSLLHTIGFSWQCSPQIWQSKNTMDGCTHTLVYIYLCVYVWCKYLVFTHQTSSAFCWMSLRSFSSSCSFSSSNWIFLYTHTHTHTHNKWVIT